MKLLGLRGVILLAVLAMVAAACTSDSGDTTVTTAAPAPGDSTTTTEAPTDTTAAPTDTTAAPAPSGATFRIGMIANITTDNWWAAIDTDSQSQNQAYLTNMKPALFNLSNPGFTLVPLLADGLPVAGVQEGDVWTTTQPLRTDMAWSDGTPVTANDLVAYFDVVRDFRLGSNHLGNFPDTVLDIEAPDDFTVKVTYDAEPGLAVWNNCVGLASFPQAAYWAPFVEEARAAGEAVSSGITDADATQALVDASLANDDDSDDITAADVTADDIAEYKLDAGANESLTVLYQVSGADAREPSAQSLIYDQWETGAFAATVTNTSYFDSGTTNTAYSDGSFRIANPGRGEDNLYGPGAGEVSAEYTEGPYIGEVLWVEHGTKDAAYEKL